MILYHIWGIAAAVPAPAHDLMQGFAQTHAQDLVLLIVVVEVHLVEVRGDVVLHMQQVCRVCVCVGGLWG
jgi:hypothetical protein